MRAQTSPSSDIVHIYTPFEILEMYGKDSLIQYLEEYQFEIQSQKMIASDKEIKYSYRQLANIWENILLGLAKDKSINLGQMIRNYYSPKNTKESQKKIVQKLFDIAMRDYSQWQEVHHETIMYGIGMIFKDTLDWANSESVVHIVGEDVANLLDTWSSWVAV